MKKAVPMILSEDNFKPIFAFAEHYSKLAKALYNAALFHNGCTSLQKFISMLLLYHKNKWM